jgi:hypothetical protein
MFTNILTALFASYKISLSPKDYTIIKMNKDDDEDLQKYWNEYLNNEYSSEDFFVDTPEELLEKQKAFANPFCDKCNIETYSLIKHEENDIISMCPKCRQTFRNNI